MSITANADIRQEMKSANVRLWQVADQLKCHESTLIRRLRHELDPEEKKAVRSALEAVKNGK